VTPEQLVREARHPVPAALPSLNGSGTEHAVLPPGGLAGNFHLVNSTSVYRTFSSVNLTTGDVFAATPGFDVNGIESVTRLLHSPFTGFDWRISGFHARWWMIGCKPRSPA
jgi:hypothetical protein